ncbi:hypothetical protein FKW77_009566 [Venturia effusa]|uniref:RNase III domain-containing protein n=1 Tax=Venturia effusa TaxID=50376 RepID=A0A517LA00_9PEZI|nr:hypothetical protein FKW77_009566 [Venturia effusa]
MTSQAKMIAEAERVLGHMFLNKDLIWEAIQAPGRTNERLALVGDAGLRLYLHQDSYKRGLTKGAASILHDQIANNSHLAEVGNAKQFSAFINKTFTHTGAIGEKAMAATVEAVIGAAYIDGEFEAMETVILCLGLH